MTTPPDFTAGSVLTAANMNKVGLWKVNSYSISSASTVQTFSNAFSADFTSYRIVATGLLAASTAGLNLRMGTTNTGYYSSAIYADASTVSATGSTNGSEWPISVLTNVADASIVIDVFSPFDTIKTTFNASGSDTRTAGYALRYAGGFINNTTSYTSFSFYASAQITAGEVVVYGYRD